MSFLTILLLAIQVVAFTQTRTETMLEKGWKFTRNDNPEQANINFNDSKWQSVRVPHDWAIYGPFDKSNDIHRMAIVQDGQTTAIEHYGRTGGLHLLAQAGIETRFQFRFFQRQNCFDKI